MNIALQKINAKSLGDKYLGSQASPMLGVMPVIMSDYESTIVCLTNMYRNIFSKSLDEKRLMKRHNLVQVSHRTWDVCMIIKSSREIYCLKIELSI